jgi:hypothetical protein
MLTDSRRNGCRDRSRHVNRCLTTTALVNRVDNNNHPYSDFSMGILKRSAMDPSLTSLRLVAVGEPDDLCGDAGAVLKRLVDLVTDPGGTADLAEEGELVDSGGSEGRRGEENSQARIGTDKKPVFVDTLEGGEFGGARKPSRRRRRECSRVVWRSSGLDQNSGALGHGRGAAVPADSSTLDDLAATVKTPTVFLAAVDLHVVEELGKLLEFVMLNLVVNKLVFSRGKSDHVFEEVGDVDLSTDEVSELALRVDKRSNHEKVEEGGSIAAVVEEKLAGLFLSINCESQTANGLLICCRSLEESTIPSNGV